MINLSRKNAKHSLIPDSLFYVIVNWISLDFFTVGWQSSSWSLVMSHLFIFFPILWLLIGQTVIDKDKRFINNLATCQITIKSCQVLPLASSGLYLCSAPLSLHTHTLTYAFHPENLFSTSALTVTTTPSYPLLLCSHSLLCAHCLCVSLSGETGDTKHALREERTQPATFRHIPGFAWIERPLFRHAYFW